MHDTTDARTPEPPYYAVVFTSVGRNDNRDYEETAARMFELARRQPGFLGVESAREGDLGITVYYWVTRGAIDGWRRHAEHVEAKRRGRTDWYTSYRLRIARVEQAWDFVAGAEKPGSGPVDGDENHP